jgi:hypothetical protein
LSSENVELHRRTVDAVNSRDLDAFLGLMDDAVEVGTRLVVMEGGYHGHEGVRRWWRDFFEFAPDYTIETIELRDLGAGMILARMRGGGHGSASGTPIDDPFWQVSRWRDRKCAYWSNFATEAEALEAARAES